MRPQLSSQQKQKKCSALLELPRIRARKFPRSGRHSGLGQIPGLSIWVGLNLWILVLSTPVAAQMPETTKLRGLADTVGFAMTPEQIWTVVTFSELQEKNQLLVNREAFYANAENPWLAAICPHDDHLLAGPVYVHVFQNLTAKRIVLMGVAHKAWRWQIENKLIFDDFSAWQGPLGPIPVASLRQDLKSRLPEKDYLVNNEFHSEEHSIEGILPFLQYYLPNTEIVPILVPYMHWSRIDSLSNRLAEALQAIIQEKNWIPGQDIAFIFSNDGAHYGDQDWGDKNYAPYGSDEAGYLKAIQRDSSLIGTTLAGPVTAARLEAFCQQVWGGADLKSYKITWCGRFAIPFGLETVRKLTEKLQRAELIGTLLRYDTSYQLGKLPLDIGLGTTAPFNIHHWVGYSAIGYR